MKLVEKIYFCETCKNYSKKIGGEMAEEFMSLGIEKILKSDINESYIVCYKSYFYSVLLNIKRDYYRENSHLIFVDDYKEKIELDYEDNYLNALNIFINTKYKDEGKRFYQDLILLTLSRSKQRICKDSGIYKDELNRHLKHAKKLIINEYNNLVSA